MIRPMIRTLLAAFAFALAAPAVAGQVSIPETDLVFDAPEGFTALSAAELYAKFPSRNAPSYAVGNARRTTTVAYGVRNVAATDAALAAQVGTIGANLARTVPGYASVEQGLRRIHDKPWAYFEMTSTAVDADIHNIMLMGVHDGRMVVVNFNATQADFVTLEPQIRASVASLRTLAAPTSSGALRIHVHLNDPIPRVARSARYGRPLKAFLADSGLGEVVGENTTLSRLGEPMAQEFDIDLHATEEALPHLVAKLKALGAPAGSELTYRVGEERRKVPIL
jgi:hypothetical protein